MTMLPPLVAIVLAAMCAAAVLWLDHCHARARARAKVLARLLYMTQNPKG